MKSRHILLVALGVLLAALIGWRLFGVQSALLPAQRGASRTPPPAPTNRADGKGAAAEAPLKAPSSAPMGAGAAVFNAAAQPRVELFQHALDAENAKPINVYGKVVDQYGQPVSGAEIKGSTLLNVGLERSRAEDFSTVTDAQGRFSFTGLHGVRFGFGAVKEGYEFDPRKYLGWWDTYKPDPNNPVVFTMWKLRGAEPMVHWKMNRIGLAVDGTASTFDLVAGKRTSGSGDIVVQFARTPLNIQRGKPFDWVLTLQIPNGGFAEIPGPYANEAPAEGYQSTVTVTMPAGAKNWTPSFDHAYFFTARNGQVFGRMTVHLVGDYVTPPTHFELEVYANPHGSRNLEYDPAKAIRPE